MEVKLFEQTCLSPLFSASHLEKTEEIEGQCRCGGRELNVRGIRLKAASCQLENFPKLVQARRRARKTYLLLVTLLGRFLEAAQKLGLKFQAVGKM